MGYSKRDYTTKEERIEMVLEKEKNKKRNRLSEYLSQPNVKKFHAIVTDKAFDRLKKDNNKGRPTIFSSREECLEEVGAYFKLRYDCAVLPTISSMALYLGFSRESLYASASSPMCDFSDILKKAISSCQAYQESPALDGTLNAPVWIFTAKNYFGMHDNQNITLSASQNTTQINPQTLDTIKEQLQLEKQDKVLIDKGVID